MTLLNNRLFFDVPRNNDTLELQQFFLQLYDMRLRLILCWPVIPVFTARLQFPPGSSVKHFQCTQDSIDQRVGQGSNAQMEQIQILLK